MTNQNHLTRARLAGVLRAAWPFASKETSRTTIATVCLEDTGGGLLVRATNGRALVTILVPYVEHGLTNPIRLSVDACKSIARGTCKVKAYSKDDHVIFEDLPAPNIGARDVRVQALGQYGKLTDDHTDVNVDPWVAFPDVDHLHLDGGDGSFTGSIASSELILVADAVAQICKVDGKLVRGVEFTVGDGHHGARMTTHWCDVRFTMTGVKL